MSQKKSTRDKVLKYLDTIYRRNARYRQLEWGLSQEKAFLLFDSACFYCGQSSTSETFTRLRDDSYKHVGIDRINSKAGYVKENVVSCCKLCNRFKNTMSIEEFKNWVDNVYKHTIEEE